MTARTPFTPTRCRAPRSPWPRGSAASSATAAIAAAYLLGSIPFGVVVAPFRHIDLRQVGSGNIGATNAARALGRKLGALVLVLDAAKAYVPLQLCRQIFHGDARESWILATV